MDLVSALPPWLGNATGWGAFTTLAILVVLGFMTGRVFPAKVVDLYRQAYLDLREAQDVEDKEFRKTVVEQGSATLALMEGFRKAAAVERADQPGAESR